MVERIDDESTTVPRSVTGTEAWSSALAWCLHEASGQKDDGIDDSYDPLRSPWIDFLGNWIGKAELGGKRQVGAVGSSLIPSLGSGSDGTQGDGVPKHFGAVPFMVSLVRKCLTLWAFQLGHVVEAVGVTGNESSATEQIGMLGHVVRLCEEASIGDGLLGGEAL